jgi:hypothetical protein
MKRPNLGFWIKLDIPKIPLPAHCAQWAETVILWKFGHSSSKKHDTDVFLGSLEACYEGGHEKMTKSEIWGTMADWGQIVKFTKFQPRCLEMTQT